MKHRRVFILVALVCLALMFSSGGWTPADARWFHRVQKIEHFIEADSGAIIYTVEKKLRGYQRFKHKRPVLLIHGVGIGYGYYDLEIRDYSMMEFLAKRGFDVYAVDQRGYGRSTIPEDGTTVRGELTAADLKSVIDFIKARNGYEEVDLVGHSWGAVVALIMAGKYEEDIGKIVLIGMPYKKVKAEFQPILDFVIGLAESGVPYIPNELHLTVEQELYSYEQDVVDLYHEIAEEWYPMLPTGPFLDFVNYEYSNYVPQINVPTLLLSGALDEVVDLADAVECLQDLGAVEKDLLFLGNAWHLTFLEELAHDRQNQAVFNWLNN